MDAPRPLFAPERPATPHQPREFALSPPWHMRQPTLKDFQRLPLDLQNRIWDLAVYLRNTRPRGGRFDTSPLGIDMPTALSVALVSRDCYRRIIPRIYQRIWIGKPSALRELQATLAARPNLGLLVEALHVGPGGKLAERSWAVRAGVERKSGKMRALFMTTIMHHPLRPYWCCPTHEFDVPCSDKDGKRKVVSDAIEAASAALDVDIFRAGYDSAGRDIGSDAWRVRLFEVQAALNLFLIEMGRREKENNDQYGERTSYPRLKLVDKAWKSEGEDVLIVSCSQLRDHIAMPGATTDHFDHPLLFARSGSQGQKGLDSGMRTTEGQRDAADCFSVLPTPAQRLAKLPLDDVCDHLHRPLPSTATIGGILGLVRSVLSLAHNIKSLSFKGFFELAVCGTLAPPQLPALTSMTVGPHHGDFEDSLQLGHPALSSLERLRLAGHLLTQHEVSCIVGENGALPQLKHVQYSAGAKYSEEAGHPWSIVDVVKHLCGLGGAVKRDAGDADAGAQSKKKARESNEEVQSFIASHRSHPLYIELRLVPEDAKAVLDSAPTSEMREAWRTGQPMPGSAMGNRLQVFVSRGYEDTRFAEWASMKLSWQLQGEAEEWWDEGLRAVSCAEEEAMGEAGAAAA